MRVLHRGTDPCRASAVVAGALQRRATRGGLAPVARALRPWGALTFAGACLIACFESKRVVFSEDVSAPPGPVPGRVVGAVGPSEPSSVEPAASSADGERGGAEAAESAFDAPLATARVAGEADPSGADAGVAAELGPAILSDECASLGPGQPGAALFSGALVDGACPAHLDAPYATNWSTYQDSADAPVVIGVTPGCAADTCALRVDGPPPGAAAYGVYGAGVSFPLAVNGGVLDASRFTGVQFWAHGTILGTRGPGGIEAPQTAFVKLVTSTARLGDDFGAYCTIDPKAWTLCRSDFASLAREGFSLTPDPSTDVLDVQRSLRLELEFRLYRPPSGAVVVPVSMAIDLASLSFY